MLRGEKEENMTASCRFSIAVELHLKRIKDHVRFIVLVRHVFTQVIMEKLNVHLEWGRRGGVLSSWTTVV